MSKLLKTLKEYKVTKNTVAYITGLSVPTVRKYLKEPDLFSVKSGKVLIKHLKSKNYEQTFGELFNIEE
jgi:predicted transcriptional regulator